MSIFKPTEFIKKICKIPIDPDEMCGMYDYPIDKPWPEECQLIQTNRVYPMADYFAIWLEIMKSICNGVDWHKKARIIIEYDPGKKKFAISTFADKHESDASGNPSK